MERDARSAMSAEPNVTPMIDVLLVLLVIFMFMVPMRRMRLDAQLPDPTARGEGAVGLVLEVAAGGRYALDREPVRDVELDARLRAVFAGRPCARPSPWSRRRRPATTRRCRPRSGRWATSRRPTRRRRRAAPRVRAGARPDRGAHRAW